MTQKPDQTRNDEPKRDDAPAGQPQSKEHSPNPDHTSDDAQAKYEG
ncbi:hypothetical protein [Falsirhodobacter sp. 20TX0035]|nr:hypothetical protein [Falsirhodobacter sp. 20TX0035]MDB6453377.1 hypothetical protein [Falsirhodobacter sp. 20TX0035]